MKRIKLEMGAALSLVFVFLGLSFRSLSNFRVHPIAFSPDINIAELAKFSVALQNGLESPLLLSVPFYVYSDINWLNATWDGNPILERSQQKNSDDYWFMYNALRHPMRTFNASEAKLFVIPTLNNVYDTRSWYKHKKLCVEGMCNEDLMSAAAENVMGSLHFRQNPGAHLTVSSHYAHCKPRWFKKFPKQYMEMLQKSANIQFEDKKTNMDNCWSEPKTYVATACPLQKTKTQDIALISTLKERDKRFRDRGMICSWLNKYNETFRMEFCGHGSMCPALANAKFGFHVRGDSHGSGRLFDTILSGTVPIFTLKKQYHILPQWFQWEKISYFIDMKLVNETEFVKELQIIISDSRTYQEKHHLLMKNRHYFDWRSLYPFDTYMYMLQSALYPENRHQSYFIGQDSVLELPPPLTVRKPHTMDPSRV